MDNKINQLITKYTPLILMICFITLISLVIFYYNDTDEINNSYDDETKIIFVQNEVKLNYGDNIQLKDYIEYDDSSNLIWESNNNEFVSVDQNGNINILKNQNGSVIITVSLDDNSYSDSIKLNIVSKNSNSDSNNNSDKDNSNNTIPNKDNNSSNNNGSSNNNSNNNSSNNNGSNNGSSNNNSNRPTQNIVNVMGISLNDKEVTMNYGETKKLEYNILPSNATNKNVIWSSNNSSFVSVDQNGNINILKNMNGSVIISVKTQDGNYISNVTLNIKRKEIKVSGISLNKTSDKILLNSSNNTITLNANVYPKNADNKNVIWSSSNPEIASVNKGVITGHKLGSVTITAKTKDGNFSANCVVNVEKNVIIVIGASQVSRMAKHKKSYTSDKNNYSVSDNTLIYVHEGGSQMSYQTSDGINNAISKIKSIASNNKEFYNFHILFPLVGNTIKTYNCKDIVETNSKIINYVVNYNKAIGKVIDNGFKAKGYVISMHPVVVKESSSSSVVVNENKNSCNADYRSNRKYNYFNIAIQKIMKDNSYQHLDYIDTFNQIMKVNDIDKNYSYKITYNTTDGVHWNESTTNTYVDMMLNSINGL